jgi:hypothetical protein
MGLLLRNASVQNKGQMCYVPKFLRPLTEFDVTYYRHPSWFDLFSGVDSVTQSNGMEANQE